MYHKHGLYDYEVLQSWSNDFEEIYRKIKDKTLLSKDRLYYLLSFLQVSQPVAGDVIECGVYKGGSAYAIVSIMQQFYESNKKIFLLDSFAGCPANELSDDDYHESNDFNDVSVDAVKNFLAEFDFVKVIPGIIPDILSEISNEKFSFIHLDLNNYLPTKNALSYLYPLLSAGGVILFDDYGFPIYAQSIKRAVDEFFADRQENPIVLTSGQALIIKN